MLAWDFVTRARTCMSHNADLQEKMLHGSVLIGVGTRHEFQNELTTSTEALLYFVVQTKTLFEKEKGLQLMRLS